MINMKPKEIIAMIEEAIGTAYCQRKSERCSKIIVKKSERIQHLQVVRFLLYLKSTNSFYYLNSEIFAKVQHLFTNEELRVAVFVILVTWGSHFKERFLFFENRNRFRIGTNLKFFGRGALNNLLFT